MEGLVVKQISLAQTNRNDRRNVGAWDAGDAVCGGLCADSFELSEDVGLLLGTEDEIEDFAAGEFDGIFAFKNRDDDGINLLWQLLFELEFSDRSTNWKSGILGHLGWCCCAVGIFRH